LFVSDSYERCLFPPQTLAFLERNIFRIYYKISKRNPALLQSTILAFLDGEIIYKLEISENGNKPGSGSSSVNHSWEFPKPESYFL
jgi:hypothetical protein